MPGSVICLIGGTYSFSKTFSPAHNGTARAWIVYKAYGDSPANLVWIGGVDYQFITLEDYAATSSFLSSAYQYLEFDGLNLDGQNQVGNAFKCRWGHHLKFVGNYIKNMGSAGISSKYCDYLTADSNKVYHSGYNQGWSSGITLNSNQWLDTYVGFHNFVVNNIISGSYDGSTHHSDGNGIIMDLSNNSYDYSTANTPPALIANNVVYENGGRCIQPYVVTNIWVVNNTCYKNALDTQEAGIGEIVNSNSKNVHYINNLVYSWDNRNPYQQLQNGSNLINYKELYYGGNNNFTYSDPSQFIKADPLFLNPPPVDPTAGGQYANALAPDQLGTKLTLKGTSPAIDKGIDPSTLPGLSTEIISGLRQYLSKDINGRSRPQGTAFDLGAYEY